MKLCFSTLFGVTLLISALVRIMRGDYSLHSS